MQLVTWNIQWCRGVDGRVDPARIVAHARAFADFDVLCLQEVAANFPALEGSHGEDQFSLIAERLPEIVEYPLAKAADAHRVSEARHLRGKLVLRVR